MAKLLEGRVAVVTGSGQGVGRAIALALAEQGCKVVTNNRKPGSSVYGLESCKPNFTEEELKKVQKVVGDAESTAAEIRALGGEATPVYADVSKLEDCERIIKTAVDTYGRIDILINNGASFYNSNIVDMPVDKFEMVCNSKLYGSFYLMHYALPYMVKQKYGRILNASSNAFVGLMGMAPYSAAAAGIWAMTKSAAQDLAGTGITVNAYTPLAQTRSWHNMLATYREQGVPKEAVESGAPEGMKVGPEGMAPFFAYLCSEEAGDITGLMFNTEASGHIAVWSESEQYNAVEKNIIQDGPWTIEEVREARAKLLKDVKTATTAIDLH